MKYFKLLLAIVLVGYMTGAGRLAFAQDTDNSPFSVTIAPVQYANVNGNIGKFEALNWMPNGAVEGISDISFVKDINKDISLSIEGSEYSNDNGKGHLTLKDGDIGFFQIDYNAFRKYFDGTGGVYPYSTGTNGKIPGSAQAAQPNSPDLQMDISYFKLEAGLGPISDPFLDISYEHNSKDGDKSLESWASSYAGTSASSTARFIAPSWESVDDTVDSITLKEKKEFAGITFKGEQKAEVDYNNSVSYASYLNDPATSTSNPSFATTDINNAKLFGSDVRAEKWMFNDNTFAALGYHYNHLSSADAQQQVEYDTTTLTSGIVQVDTSGGYGWSTAKADEDEHVLVGNFNSQLTPNLVFAADARYEHMGADASSDYFGTPITTTSFTILDMENHDDQAAEHVGLRYYGLPHTSLYTEGEFEQDRNWDGQTSVSNTGTGFYDLSRLDRTQNESYTVGGRIVPNRFFTFTNQFKQQYNDGEYDTINASNTSATGLILLDALKENGFDDTSTLTWKPFHWLQNSLKYQFADMDYQPRPSPQSSGSTTTGATPNFPGGDFNISENHMLSSTFTYDITVQPIDPLLLTLSYSHVESYVRTTQASASAIGGVATPNDYIPTFNSGDNSFLFSTSYSPLENLTWTNSVCYTVSDNYVDFSSGLPLGSDFRMTNVTTSLDYTYHKWLTLGPKYEYASYKDDPVEGAGNYSANIFLLDAKFKW